MINQAGGGPNPPPACVMLLGCSILVDVKFTTPCDAPATGRENKAGTVILSSSGVPQHLVDLAAGVRVTAIFNAADNYPGVFGRAAKKEKDTQLLQNLGFVVTELDLRRKTINWDTVRQNTDVLWVGGGNTFGLLDLMHKSGFAQHVHTMVENGVIYAGESAGAVAAAPDIAGAESVDDPSPSGVRLPSKGLGLVGFFAWAHWGTPAANHLQRFDPYPGTSVPIFRFRDDEIIVVQGSDLRLGAPGDIFEQQLLF